MLFFAITSTACLNEWPLRSVHAASDKLRKQLVPTTVHPMADLRDAFRDALRCEYCLQIRKYDLDVGTRRVIMQGCLRERMR